MWSTDHETCPEDLNEISPYNKVKDNININNREETNNTFENNMWTITNHSRKVTLTTFCVPVHELKICISITQCGKT